MTTNVEKFDISQLSDENYGKGNQAKISRHLKKVLNRGFPGIKFEMRSSYKSIDIKWEDSGPSCDEATAVALSAFNPESIREEYTQVYGISLHLYTFNAEEDARHKAEYAAFCEKRREEDSRINAAVAQATANKWKGREFKFTVPTNATTDYRPVYEALDGLRQKAESDVETDEELTRRPTWGPPLTIDGELFQACVDIGYMKAEDKPIARLWARFADPKKAGSYVRENHSNNALTGIACRGFELRTGSTREGSTIIFEANKRSDGTWWLGPNYIRCEYSPPSWRTHEWETLIKERERGMASQERLDAIESKLAEIDAEDLANSDKFYRRYELNVRIVELARARVLDFAGAPDVQMRAAGHLSGHCCICGKMLEDHLSLERGIGPECYSKGIRNVRYGASEFIEAGREIDSNAIRKLAIVSGRSEGFVESVLKDNIIASDDGIALKPRRKKPTPKVNATLVMHCAVFGRGETSLSKWEVKVGPHAQHAESVSIWFVEAGKRKWINVTDTPDSTRYHTIEVDGAVVYDSRTEVPCDMEQWAETRKRFEDRPAVTVAEVAA